HFLVLIAHPAAPRTWQEKDEAGRGLYRFPPDFNREAHLPEANRQAAAAILVATGKCPESVERALTAAGRKRDKRAEFEVLLDELRQISVHDVEQLLTRHQVAPSD